MEQHESIKCEGLPETQTTQIAKEKLFHADQQTPAIVTCATVKENPYYYDEVDDTTYANEEEFDNSTLHFSTFDSDGVLLKQFSKRLIGLENYGHNPFVLCACRDLLLLKDEGVFMCNIATQELIDLPNFPDGNYCFWVTGFGYVPSTKEFKVLADLSFFKLGFKVLTLGTDRWRDLEDPPVDTKEHQRLHGGAFINGAIHLISECGTRIVTFNLEREEWGSIAGPPVSPKYSLSLKELNGYLCIQDEVVGRPSRIDIWILDYNNGSWVKASTIDFSIWNAKSLYEVEPLAIENDGRILVLVNHFSLQFYDPKTKSSREIHRFDTPDDYRGFYVKVFSSLGHR